MRVLLEILLIGLLIFIGWRQPFRDVVRARLPDAEIMPSRLAIRALEAEYRSKNGQTGARGKDGSWMFEEQGTLDQRPNPAPRK